MLFRSVPVVEWLKVDESMRAELSARGSEAIRPAQPLATAARALVDDGVTNETEFGRIFGT